MLANQAALQQQFYGIVERRATNAVFFILHFDVEGFDVEMLLAVVYLLKNREAFWRFTVSFFFQVTGKDVFK